MAAMMAARMVARLAGPLPVTAGGGVFAERSRVDPRQSAMIAALVNTRGLTELIALNVGLSAGIIHQRLFTILVLMALITTVTTGPLLSEIGRLEGRQGASPRLEEPAHADGTMFCKTARHS